LFKYPFNKEGFLSWSQSLLVFVCGTSILCTSEASAKGSFGYVVRARRGSDRIEEAGIVFVECVLNIVFALIHSDDVVVMVYELEAKRWCKQEDVNARRF
jgi:hypothetical protein